MPLEFHETNQITKVEAAELDAVWSMHDGTGTQNANPGDFLVREPGDPDAKNWRAFARADFLSCHDWDDSLDPREAFVLEQEEPLPSLAEDIAEAAGMPLEDDEPETKAKKPAASKGKKEAAKNDADDPPF